MKRKTKQAIFKPYKKAPSEISVIIQHLKWHMQLLENTQKLDVKGKRRMYKKELASINCNYARAHVNHKLKIVANRAKEVVEAFATIQRLNRG